MPRRKKQVDSKIEKENEGNKRSKPEIEETEPAEYKDDVDDNIAQNHADFKKLCLPSESGELLITGGMNWSLNGRKSAKKGEESLVDKGRNLFKYHRLNPFRGIKVSKVVSGPTANHSVLITTEGKAYTWGRNEFGQLGNGGTNRVDTPQVITALSKFAIVNAAAGRNHTLCLTDDGLVYGFGDNQAGQVGVGGSFKTVQGPTKIKFSGRPIIDVACGAQFSMIVTCNGWVFSFGCPEYGQLGNNTDGKYIAVAKKIEYNNVHLPERVIAWVSKTKVGTEIVSDVEIKQIACGTNHTIALDRKGRVFSWGFGGFGRLGHGDPKDEMVPRLIDMFSRPTRGATKITSGSTFNIAFSELGSIFFWGLQGSNKESTMYPKPLSDLYGWDVRSIGCGSKHIAVAADKTIIAWGPQVCNGELGFGPSRKSSTNPDIVKDMDGTHVFQVSCGSVHTMAIVRNESPEEKKKIESYPVYSP